MDEIFSHVPVLYEASLQALNIRPDGLYIDGTAGGGGHSRAIAARLTTGRLYSFDQDPSAVAAAKEALQGLPAEVIQENFRYAVPFLQNKGIEAVDGVLLDLGVSSHQLDCVHRGFSYHGSAPLDMRMSQSGTTAADLVNHLSREELATILREYGEEKFAWQIAGKIVKAREEQALSTTEQLAQIVISALPPAERRKAKNPARKSFQALRMAVNEEMQALSEGLNSLFGFLKPTGRFAVITFHSLEDRMVKQRFKQFATVCTCPPQWPVCQCGGVAQGVLVGKKPTAPTLQEQEENRRSRSAKLRCIEKL